MSNLPQDLVEEILTRVPATYLKRIQSTCKQWNDLFKDQRFRERHFLKASKQFLVLMLKEYSICSMSFNLHEIHNNLAAPAPSLRLKHEPEPKDSHSNNSEQVKIYKIFHCDGFLLCTTIDHKLVVWNPCTGQTRWIPPCYFYITEFEFALGYENNKSCRNYKILGYYDYYKEDDEFEIYDFSSDSWRALDVVKPFMYTGKEVSLKGNTYWLASNERQRGDILLSFDFTTETYKYLNLPLDVYETVGLTVVREEQLLVLQKRRFNTLEMEVWVTTNDKIDETTKDLSWSKFLAIDLSSCYGWLGSMGFFIDEEKKMAVCCVSFVGKTCKAYIVGEDKYFREISFKMPRMPFIFNYVPSLLQIPQATVLQYRN